ncbi:MAG: helix-turn-helix transcriptional regulator [Chloroflexi bacterium]|nr:helix-turn-helix transcriptional regulator [Chloroflexota bacterium]
MAAPQLPIGIRELERKRRRVREHAGVQVRELREESGISQAALAAAAGIDQGHLSRIERGLVQPSIDVLVAVASALGADLGMRLFAGAGPRIRDRLQAPIVEALIRQLHPRWRPFPELAVPKARGFIDLAIGLRDNTAGVACEVHSELRAIDTIQRRVAEKAAALADTGVVGRTVTPLLLIRSTATTLSIVRTFEATLAASFPAAIETTLEAVRGPSAPWPGPGILWARLQGGRAEILERPPRGIRLGRREPLDPTGTLRA